MTSWSNSGRRRDLLPALVAVALAMALACGGDGQPAVREAPTDDATPETMAQSAPSPVVTMPASPVPAWRTLAPLPTPRSEVATVALDGKVYVIGGMGPADAGVKAEVYDPATDTWRAVAPLPQPLHHPAAAAVGGKIYVIGGFRDGFLPVSDVYEYDPASDSWRRRASLPTPGGHWARPSSTAAYTQSVG